MEALFLDPLRLEVSTTQWPHPNATPTEDRNITSWREVVGMAPPEFKGTPFLGRLRWAQPAAPLGDRKVSAVVVTAVGI